MKAKWKEILSPIVYLSNNWLSLAGVVIVTSATILWLFVLPVSLRGELANPYLGILLFLILPAAFFAGLVLIPIGMWWRSRREHRSGTYPAVFPAVGSQQPALRRLLLFIAIASILNLAIGSQLTYQAVSYMDSVTFCGQACHTVMQPEFTAYENAPHSRVECVKCHIGPGATWFLRSKLSGVRRVFALTFHTYSRPIPAPVADMRPSRETCEACHWPQKPEPARLRVISSYKEDEANTISYTVLRMRGGNTGGIHGAHFGPGIEIHYRAADPKRQNIPWVEYRNKNTGESTTYLAQDAKANAVRSLPRFEMQCTDCHNRPAHTFELAERAVDRALHAGLIPVSLPYVKKKSLEILKTQYVSREDAGKKIAALLAAYYQHEYPDLYMKHSADIVRAGNALRDIYNRNIFPEMNVDWGTYLNNIGHTDFPGCFRCHDEAHVAGQKSITQNCEACHQMLAVDEAAPEILKTLGMETNVAH